MKTKKIGNQDFYTVWVHNKEFDNGYQEWHPYRGRWETVITNIPPTIKLSFKTAVNIVINIKKKYPDIVTIIRKFE